MGDGALGDASVLRSRGRRWWRALTGVAVVTFYPAGGAGAPAGRSPRTLPSGNVTDTNSPPGVPSRIGRTVTLTLSPVLSGLDFQPERSRNVGDVISIDQVATTPFSFGTSRSKIG